MWPHGSCATGWGTRVGASPTTRWQVGGHRFLVRRFEHALVRRESRMTAEPLRARSRALMVGAVIAALGLAASAALAFIRPQDKMGDSVIVIGRDSGAMYVVVDEVVHPVMSLASARLIAGQPDDPVTVKESELETRARGALVGIPGSPTSLAVDPDSQTATWTVCDTVDAVGAVVSKTTVLVTDSPVQSRGDVTPLGVDGALLWEYDGSTYLVYDGVRARIDVTDAAVTRALGLDGATPSPVSAALLDSVREAPPVTPPVVAGAGRPTPYPFGGLTVGSVASVDLGDREQFYVALNDGVQPIAPATAQLLRFADSQGRLGVESITPDTLDSAPQTRNPLPVASFPKTVPRLVDVDAEPVACLSWRAQPGANDEAPTTATVEIATGRMLPLLDGERPVELAGADGPGPASDEVFVEPGSGFFVQTTGAGEDITRRDAMFYVADTGVRFGIPDLDSAKALGFGTAAAAPWAIVSLCAPGPVLGRVQARVAHDGIDPDRDASELGGG
ncbi:type VII secretion protein EccB [Actinomycetes bacterium M1A6_2h]